MILPRFDVLVPETVEQACTMLTDQTEAGVKILAGGTDLLVDLRRPIIHQHVPRCDGCPSHPDGDVLTTLECDPPEPEPLVPPNGSIRQALADKDQGSPGFLISLHKLDELKGISVLDNGSLRIGALTTIAEIEQSDIIRKDWAALADGADSLGSPLVRFRGTIGGNIANARPAADSAIPVIALNGLVNLKSASGSRTVAVENFHTGPGLSVMKPDEILTDVILPAPRAYSASAYYKLANRKALEISTVGVSVWVTLERPDGPILDVRVALGAVGPKPLLAKSVAEKLIGQMPDERLIKEAARAARNDARPIDDHRGTAWYRLEMVEALTYRLLSKTIKDTREKG